MTIMSDQPLCMLTVHAHPDDEASKGAPTLAMYGASGVRTVLVCCTGGEEGDINNPGLKEPGQPFHDVSPERERELLAQMRPLELDASAQAIGFHAVHMLGYRDSGMLGSEANKNPECFHMATNDDATERLVRLIRLEKPQVIITYNDDQSAYPHPDHIKVHDISLLAFHRAGDPMWYPDAGPVWQPAKMYYTIWSKSRLVAMHEAMLKLRGKSPFDEKWLNRANQDYRITTKLDIGAFMYARSAALRAHATQIDPNEMFWFGLSDEELAEVYPYDDWVLARSIVDGPQPGTFEDDLFAGVRNGDALLFSTAPLERLP